jgi:hypothetical protein
MKKNERYLVGHNGYGLDFARMPHNYWSVMEFESEEAQIRYLKDNSYDRSCGQYIEDEIDEEDAASILGVKSLDDPHVVPLECGIPGGWYLDYDPYYYMH